MGRESFEWKASKHKGPKKLNFSFFASVKQAYMPTRNSPKMEEQERERKIYKLYSINNISLFNPPSLPLRDETFFISSLTHLQLM